MRLALISSRISSNSSGSSNTLVIEYVCINITYYHHSITATITLTSSVTTNATNTKSTNTYSRVIRLISD